MKRWWSWTILTMPRRCVICGGKIPGGTMAAEANYRGKITLCLLCREALDKEGRLQFHDRDKPELFEGFDIEEE